MRIDNSDFTREQKNASDKIIKTLELHGFEWDGTVQYQSDSYDLYQKSIDFLKQNNHVFRCECSRKNLIKNKIGSNGFIYTGTCHNKIIHKNYSLRVFVSNTNIEFTDTLQGNQKCSLESEISDFIIWRRDNIASYHLATVIDDNELNVTNIVRGFDLINSTFCQIHLQNILNHKTPSYSHIPIVIDQDGNKLSKQFGACGIENEAASKNLYNALVALCQEPPEELSNERLDSIWDWAIVNWDISKLRMLSSLNHIEIT